MQFELKKNSWRIRNFYRVKVFLKFFNLSNLPFHNARVNNSEIRFTNLFFFDVAKDMMI